jgi:hypothetical protein
MPLVPGAYGVTLTCQHLCDNDVDTRASSPLPGTAKPPGEKHPRGSARDLLRRTGAPARTPGCLHDADLRTYGRNDLRSATALNVWTAINRHRQNIMGGPSREGRIPHGHHL